MADTGDTMPSDPDAVRVQPQPKDERVVSGQSAIVNPSPTAKGGKGGPAYIAEQLWPLAVPIDTLTPDPANARKHGEKNMAAIRASLSRFGQRAPIVVQRQGMVIRAGNGRWLAAKAMGWTQIAAVVVDDSSIDAVAFAIADNRTAELAEWDNEVLANLLNTMPEEDMAATGFDEADLNELLSELTPKTEQDAEPQTDRAEELRVKWGVERGQVWTLGEHRLMCGDSTSAEDVGRLMAGERADLCFTSPPYALGASIKLSGNRKLNTSESAYKEHDDDAGEWPRLMRGWFAASSESCSAWVVNVQPLAGNKRELMRWIADNAEKLVDIAIWDKGHAAPAMAAGVLGSRYEMLVILGRPGATRAVPYSSWRGTVQSVYEGPPQRNNDDADIHGATMPMHLPLWVLGSLCDRAESVYEPFCGTGTTIIACEQLKRKCRAMEISPVYVAVALQRWADATGGTPTRV